MRDNLCRLFLALCLIPIITCAAAPLPVMRSRARNAARLRAVAEHAAAHGAPPVIPERWYQQRTDHFEVTASNQGATWMQRYWVNEQYWNPNTGGPIFVQLGEEAAADSSYVTSMAMSDYGSRHGALLVGIEHRGYGASKVTPSLTTEGMKYLSVDQALADFANIIDHVRAEYGAMGQKIVVFGCSYIGAGASWFRQRYGHLAVGAIASSAPVQAVVDFVQYLDQVEIDLAEFYGGSCVEAIQNATAQITQLLTTQAGTMQVEKMFNVCTPFTGVKDVQTFWSNVVGNPWMGGVQYYNEPGQPTIQAMCGRLLSFADPLQGFANVSLQYGGNVCNDCSYADALAQLTSLVQPTSGVGDRTWTWQTCSQFGYFQTTDSPNQPFGSGMPLQYSLDLCNDAFGMTFNLTANIDNTNRKFGGNVLPPYAYTNVVFAGTKSGVWQVLAPQASVNPTVPLLEFNSEGHCAGVFPITNSTPPDIVVVHEEIRAVIDSWLL